MRKKFSIDSKKVLAFEMTAPSETILVAQVVNISRRGGRGGGVWGGRGASLYKPYRYVPPHRVRFLCRFGLKTGIHFAVFGLESGMVFEGTTECVNVFSVSFPNE